MTPAITRKQREQIDTAAGLADGLSARQTAEAFGVHPAAVMHHRRRLRHLRVTAADIAATIYAAEPGAVDAALLALFRQRRQEQKQRTKAARRNRKSKGDEP